MPWRNAWSEEYSENMVELWWCDTVRQLADNLTKLATPSSLEFFKVISSGVIDFQSRDGTKTFERPRPTQQAHSFWVQNSTFLKFWNHGDLAAYAEQTEQVAVASLQHPLPHIT